MAAKLPNCDSNFSEDFGVDFFSCFFFKKEGPKKSCSVDFGGRKASKLWFEFFCGFGGGFFLLLFFPRKKAPKNLAVWILVAAKLPICDSNFSVDFGVDFFFCFFQERNPPQKIHQQKSPGNPFGQKFPLGFLQKPLLDKVILTVRVKLITGSLLTLENLFPQSYRYRLEVRTNSFNYHFRYRIGVCSHPFISIDSQSPSWKPFELISPNYRYRYRLEILSKFMETQSTPLSGVPLF